MRYFQPGIRESLLLDKLLRIPHTEFLLHGTGRPYKRLTPRKPRYAPQKHPRGVYATALIPLAALYALNKDIFQWKYRVRKPRCIEVHLRKEFRLRYGYIHVVKRSDFWRKMMPGHLALMSSRPVRSIRSFRVGPEFLMLLERRHIIQFVEQFTV